MKSFHIDPTAGDYYSRLGLSPDASVDEIRKAGKKAFSQYHPDNDDTIDSNELYYRLKDAKDTLEKSNDRREYDVFYEYSEEYRAYTTQLYEKWVRKSRPRTAKSWLEDNFDPNEALEVDEPTTIGELIGGDVETEEPSTERDEDSSITPEGDGDGEGDNADHHLEHYTPSPTPTEQDDQDEGESDEDSQEEKENGQEDDAHFDQQDSGYTDPTPDDERESGLDGSDLRYIQNKMNSPMILGSSATLTVGDDNQSIVLTDSFRETLEIDITTGRVSAPQTLRNPVADRFLTKVYAHVDRGDGVLNIGYAKDSVDNVEVILDPDSYFGSGDDADDTPSHNTFENSGVPSNYDTDSTPVEYEWEDTDDDTSNNTTEKDSDDTDNTSPTPDDPRDSGLSDSDLKKIRNREGLHAVIEETGDRASYDDEDKSITIRSYDIFDNKIRIDLNTGKLSMVGLDKANKHQLKKVSVELARSGRFLRVTNQLRSSGGTVRVKLLSVPPSSSSPSSSGNSNNGRRDGTYRGGSSVEEEKNDSHESTDESGSKLSDLIFFTPLFTFSNRSLSFLKSFVLKSSYVIIFAAVTVSVIGAGLYSIYTYRYVLFEIFVILSVFSPIIILFIAAIRSD